MTRCLPPRRPRISSRSRWPSSSSRPPSKTRPSKPSRGDGLFPLLAAALFHRGWIGASGPVLLTAIVAIPLSIVLYGGILAAAGGVLTIAGTLLATREGTT